ncbi:MAG: two pore domain potassium channel family protein [Herpetosiphonaceae bacterium]|nr:two pore domain potassium channel family protein [Herpetosiphonaceae bacterium]
MRVLATIGGFVLLGTILFDAFQTMILPRRAAQGVRLTRLFYRLSWTICRLGARLLSPGNRRENYLSFYGPLSLLLLLVIWAAGLVASFACLQWALGSHLSMAQGSPTINTDLYMSGTTFFTLGLGDVTPNSALARVLTVIEAGTGFGFLAVVIGYLPVLYQAFSRREVSISLLDARAGSPSSAVELLRRLRPDEGTEPLIQLLRDWERWAAELLESHISFPVLAYYRSQHDQQSWLGALTTILDLCALVIVGCDGATANVAQLTFAICRHAAVDLSQILNARPDGAAAERLPAADFQKLRTMLEPVGVFRTPGSTPEQRVQELRRMYEPYLNALSHYLLVTLPTFVPANGASDDWQTSAWEHVNTNSRH